jgi:Tfp pilus assembly protein PilN
MINVNLLPQEFRQRERTPIRIFMATVAASCVVATTGAAFAYLRLGKLASEEQTLSRLNEDRQSMEPQLKHHAALGAEIAEKEKWQQAIRDLRNSRITWSRKFDQLIDLVSQSGDQGRYLIWFNDLQVTQTLDGKTSGGTVTAKGMSNGDDVGKVALFFGDLKRHEFFKEFAASSEPEGKVPDGKDSNTVEFPITLTIASRDSKKADAKKPAGEQTPAADSPKTTPEKAK